MLETTRVVEVNGWTLKGVGLSEKNIEKVSKILLRTYFDSPMIRNALSCLIPITIDKTSQVICFWQVTGVTFFSHAVDITFPRTTMYLPEVTIPLFEHELSRKNVSDEEIALRLKKVFCCNKEVSVRQANHYVYFY